MPKNETKLILHLCADIGSDSSNINMKSWIEEEQKKKKKRLRKRKKHGGK